MCQLNRLQLVPGMECQGGSLLSTNLLLHGHPWRQLHAVVYGRRSSAALASLYGIMRMNEGLYFALAGSQLL